MTKRQIEKYRETLRSLVERVRQTSEAIREEVRGPTGGEAAGSLSNTPMHLADVGSAVYSQELNAALLENEEFIRHEAIEAIQRIDQGRFGACESCGKVISKARLDAIPYARACIRCAELQPTGREVNMDSGRPRHWPEDLAPAGAIAGEPRLPGQSADVHAAGTPGGGSAVGGLAGTTICTGNPADASLEQAMGSGSFDVQESAEESETGYGSPEGGAVGGTPAGKRVRGGGTGRPPRKPR